MRPMEAYENVMRFAAERGEPVLRLALHAAVPQSFRPDLLHLLRLNFVPDASYEAESDVLLAPFCEDAGGGYYQFDPEVRRLLLDNLDPTYPDERGNRIRRVADFLATYIESRSGSLSEEQNRLSQDFLSIQGWVALAFRDPDIAAAQFAAALDQGTRENLAARVQFSGLASALSIPLVQYPRLLTYAAGLEALEQGRTKDAADLLERLPDEEIQIGGVKLRSPRQFLARPAIPEKTEETVSRVSYKKCFVAYTESDREFVQRLRRDLREQGVPIWFAPEELRAGADLEASIRDAILLSDVLLVVLSSDALRSPWVRFEVETALGHSIRLIPLDLGDREWEDTGWLSTILKRFSLFDFHGADDPEIYSEALAGLLYSLRTDVAPAEDVADLPVSSVQPGRLGEVEWGGARRRPVILFMAHEVDRLCLRDPVEYLLEKNVEVAMSTATTLEELSDEIRKATCVILVFGSVSGEWIVARLRELVKLAYTTDAGIEMLGVFLAPPPGKDLSRLKLPGGFTPLLMDNSNSFDPRTLASLLGDGKS